MTDPIALWHAEHVRFSQLLDFIEREMSAFHAGRAPDYELMRDVVHYLHHYGDRFHHPREDVAFGRLLTRAPELLLPINRLLQEHRVIGVAGEELLEHLDQVLNDVPMKRCALEAAAATYLVYYRHHLATEERELLPRAGELLDKSDWRAVSAAVTPAPDPLFGDESSHYRRLREQIRRETGAPTEVGSTTVS